MIKRKQAGAQPIVMSDKTHKRLGRGLSDLGLKELLYATNDEVSVSLPDSSHLQNVAVHTLKPGAYQPRRQMSESKLQELADSIRVQGIIQPIIARCLAEENYEIIAGERRWRAAQIAGLDRVPVIVRNISDQAAMAFALIENIQREDLNIVEEALALQRLLAECNLTHEAVAEAVGKSRASVTNMLRLLKLNGDVRVWLESGQLDMGHARALLTLKGDTQSDYARRVVERGLSVRETEAMVQRARLFVKAAGSPAATFKDPDILRLQMSLSDKLGADVAIRHGLRGRGRLIIGYNNLEELEGILEKIH